MKKLLQARTITLMLFCDNDFIHSEAMSKTTPGLIRTPLALAKFHLITQNGSLTRARPESSRTYAKNERHCDCDE